MTQIVDCLHATVSDASGLLPAVNFDKTPKLFLTIALIISKKTISKNRKPENSITEEYL